MDPLDARSLIPLNAHYIHMNHAGESPMTERSRAAIEQVVDGALNRPYLAGAAFEEADRVRGLAAQLINASPDGVALTRSTAHGLSLVAQGLDWNRGDNVVGAEWEYPANVYPWMALAADGVEFRQARLVGGRVLPDTIFAMVDERTRVVAVSHVEFWNGFRVNIEAIGAECRRRGIVFAVDMMQSAGALRVDVSRMPIDFCAAGAGKWLLGPPGIGFCYFTPDLLQHVRPRIVGADSVDDYEQYFEPKLRFAPTARRFEESVISMLDTAAFGSALDLLLEVGTDVIEERVLDLANRLATGLVERGYEVVEPWPRTRDESSGIVSFRKPGATHLEVLRDLNAARVIARTHRDFVRLSPHFYNTEDEIDRVLEVLAPEAVSR
ncbi:MAG TPA: aminotransferase class V-fold PLP-dependent enzyme [Candidatus Dormibacteraeota bacterium]|jgi:selenocysteine lyase/cysteine desulfurase